MYPQTEHEARLLNHHAEMIDIMVIIVHRIIDMRVSMVMMIPLVIFLAAIEMTVNSLAFAIQVAVDLITFFLEAVRLAIIASLCGTIGLAVEFLLDAITLGIQVSLDAITLGSVTVVFAAVPTFIGEGG